MQFITSASMAMKLDVLVHVPVFNLCRDFIQFVAFLISVHEAFNRSMFHQYLKFFFWGGLGNSLKLWNTKWMVFNDRSSTLVTMLCTQPMKLKRNCFHSLKLWGRWDNYFEILALVSVSCLIKPLLGMDVYSHETSPIVLGSCEQLK